ncbi:MAG: hypothetical protein V3V61_07405, partial [Gammaproteobacteria bacterium]
MASEARFTITAIDNTQQALGRIQNNFTSLSRTASRLLGPLMAITGSVGFGALIKQSIDAGDKIQKLSIRLGASTEALSQYRHVADISGVSFERFTTSLERLQRSLSEAATQSGKAQNALSALGLTAQDLVGLKPEVQFELIAQALTQIDNQADKARLAYDLMGRSGTEMLQIMEGGAQSIRALREEADALGLTLSQRAANDMAGANDAILRLQNSVKGLANILAIELAPALTQTIDLMGKFTSFYFKGFNSSSLSWMATSIDKISQGLKAWQAPAWLQGVQNKASNWLDGYNLVAQALVVAEQHSETLNQSTGALGETVRQVSEDFQYFYNPALQETYNKQQKLIQSNQQLTDSEKAKQALIKEGVQLTELMRTPQEVYQDQLEQTNKLLQAGAIEQETYNRALGAYETALKQATQTSAQFQQQFVLIFSQG